MKRIYQGVVGEPEENSQEFVAAEVARLNVRRVQYIVVVGILAHVTLVVLFLLGGAGASEPASTRLWRADIITAHSAMSVWLTAIGIATYLLGRRGSVNTRVASLIASVMIVSYLLLGVAAATIDQLTMPSISGLLVISTGVAVVVLIRPRWALVYFVLEYLLFYFSASWTQHDETVLLSLRVNSLAACAISFLVTISIWRNQTATIRQRWLIGRQSVELEEKNRLLEALATRDPLTNLLNRAKFHELATLEASRLSRNGRSACLLLIDLDNYKQINDTYGHPDGDQVLREVAASISSLIRVTDVAARFGGDEFAVLLPDTTLVGGAAVAEKLRRVIEEHRVEVPVGRVSITASVGVSALVADSSPTFDTSYRAADAALYRAKAGGRNRVEVADAVPADLFPS